jgi:hypothetical protein
MAALRTLWQSPAPQRPAEPPATVATGAQRSTPHATAAPPGDGGAPGAAAPPRSATVPAIAGASLDGALGRQPMAHGQPPAKTGRNKTWTAAAITPRLAERPADREQATCPPVPSETVPASAAAPGAASAPLDCARSPTSAAPSAQDTASAAAPGHVGWSGHPSAPITACVGARGLSWPAGCPRTRPLEHSGSASLDRLGDSPKPMIAAAQAAPCESAELVSGAASGGSCLERAPSLRGGGESSATSDAAALAVRSCDIRAARALVRICAEKPTQ